MLLAALPLVAAPARAEYPVNAAGWPVYPPRVDAWLPRDWWTPEQAVSGRLNDDDYDDVVVVVQRRVDAPEDPAFPRGSRALFVLYGMPDGRWLRGALVPGLLPCGECTSALAGTIGAALFELELSDDGLLSLGWVARDRGTKAVRLIIGWDPTFRALGLYADDVRLLRPRGGESHVRRDYRAGRMWVDGVAEDMPARFIPIEEVSASQY